MLSVSSGFVSGIHSGSDSSLWDCKDLSDTIMNIPDADTSLQENRVDYFPSQVSIVDTTPVTVNNSPRGFSTETVPQIVRGI